jgi:hypothetical protein
MQKLLLAAPGAAMLTRRDALASHPDRRAQLIQIVALHSSGASPTGSQTCRSSLELGAARGAQ